MFLISNNLCRSVLCKKFYSGLVNAAQIKIQKSNYATIVTTSKDAKPPTNAETEGKMNNAARIFMERAREYDEMIEDARAEYRLGLRHLANMMGSDPETFTQKDAEAAIQYLFPSGIYDKKARPFMKPPEQVYPPRKRIQFDKTGRPFHYMFFTGFPHYYNLCHETVEHMRNLDKIEDKDIQENKEPNLELKLNLESSVWLNKEKLQNKIIEDISDKQYEDFVVMMDRLLQHPYSHECKDFIMQYRQTLKIEQKGREIVEAKIGEDGRKYVTSYECRFRTSIANVTVISPGTGNVEINGRDINYFELTQPKEMVFEEKLIKKTKRWTKK